MENCNKEFVAAYLTNIWAKSHSSSTYITDEVIQEKFAQFYKTVNKESQKYGR